MSRSVSRRLLVGGTSTALLLGAVGLVPLLSPASAACTPTYTDPAGDSGFLVNAGAPVPVDPTADDDIDITAVTYTVDAGVFSATVTVKALADAGPATANGDIFNTAFTVNGKAGATSALRDFSGSPFAATPVSGKIVIGGTSVANVKVVSDTKSNSVTVSAPLADVAKAAGGDLTGKPFSAMTAESRDDYGFSNAPTGGTFAPAPRVDQAAAPASASYVFGNSCSGGSGATGGGTPSGSPSPTPSPSASTPPPSSTLFDQPRKGCVQFTDPPGDADPTGTGANNEQSLDVLQVNLKSPEDGSVQVYVKVANLGGGTNLPEEGGLYDVTFNLAGKAVEAAVDDTGAVTSAMVGGKANTDLKPTAKLDTKNSEVVFTFNKAGLEKALATTLTAGTAVTGTTITTSGTFPAVGAQTADTAAGTTAAQKTYSYGDNTCFLPPAGTFSIDADPSGEYSHVTELFATLNDSDGSPVPGVPVTASLSGGKAVTAITDNDGVADLKLPLALPAGKKTLSVAFAGNSDVGATKGSAPFTVVPDKSVLKAKGIRGGVQATLLDDAKHAIAGQAVVFTIGSTHKVVKTNSKGVAVLGGLRAGTVVRVAYGGKSGYYTATPTYTVKSL